MRSGTGLSGDALAHADSGSFFLSIEVRLTCFNQSQIALPCTAVLRSINHCFPTVTASTYLNDRGIGERAVILLSSSLSADPDAYCQKSFADACHTLLDKLDEQNAALVVSGDEPRKTYRVAVYLW